MSKKSNPYCVIYKKNKNVDLISCSVISNMGGSVGKWSHGKAMVEPVK